MILVRNYSFMVDGEKPWINLTFIKQAKYKNIALPSIDEVSISLFHKSIYENSLNTRPISIFY